MDRQATSKAVAAALGVKPTTVQRYARERKIPFDVTPGGHRRFNIDEVRAVMAAPTGFVAVQAFAPLATGNAVERSPASLRDAELRAVRLEHPAPHHGDEGAVHPFGELIGRARRVLVASGS